MASSATMAEHVIKLYREIHAVVRRIPRGHVATYGQVAELAGLPGGARVAGAAMKTCKPGDRLPWQRVIGKAGRNRGRIAIHDPVGAAVQRQLLSDEGVAINDHGLIALDRYGWLPGSAPRKRVLPAAKALAVTLKKADRRGDRRAATTGSGRGEQPRRPPRSASKRRASSSRR
jgi:methylated-DNA-protein-cysteine methyltransferase-like protein